MTRAPARRHESPAKVQARAVQRDHADLWRMVPFAARLTEAQRERIDRLCLRERRHLGELLAELVGIGLEERPARGLNGAGVPEVSAA